MVLARIALAALLLAGCKQSLFDNGGGGDDTTMVDANGGIDTPVQSSCGTGCLADAAADFGTAKWQYFDDHRDRSWAAMTQSGSAYVGANAANKIAQGTGTLLVSTAGNGDPADPAIAFSSATKQTIKLSFIVDIPASAPSHTVRLYRNSREDSLFTKIGLGGMRVESSIVVDAFAGDRFLLAISPNGATGAMDIPVSFFVNETTMQFPSECALGLQFSTTAAHTVLNECGAAITYYHNNGDNSFTGMDPTLLAQGAFPEMGMAADIPFDMLYSGDTPLDRNGDTTTQFWYKHRSFSTGYDAVLYSDQDCDAPGVIGGLVIYRRMNMIGAQACADPDPIYANGAFPEDGAWHFIRVVHTAGRVNLCVDGTKALGFNLPAGGMHTDNPPYIGENVDYSPVVAALDAGIDDVRVLKTALPCE